MNLYYKKKYHKIQLLFLMMILIMITQVFIHRIMMTYQTMIIMIFIIYKLQDKPLLIKILI
jgi:hypothetical protein